MRRLVKLAAFTLAVLVLWACGSGSNYHHQTSADASRHAAPAAPDNIKAASTPPTNAGSQVPDLTVSDNGDGTLALQWHYYNAGDYNQDGTVNVSDITPLAIHYNHDPGTDEMDIILHPSGVGKVGIADVTPIAMNFGSEVAGYEVQFAGAPDAATWTDALQVPIASATGSARPLFQVNAPTSNEGWCCVTPYDSGDVKGIRSVPMQYLLAQSHWHTVTVDSPGVMGYFVSLAVVNGKPAISYTDGSNSDLMYAQAAASDGSAWNEPVRVDFTGSVGQDNALGVIDGNPAISYFDSTNHKLKFARAADADGAAWETPITVADETYDWTWLISVLDYPAVVYTNSNDLSYIRATAPDGSTWGTPHIAQNDLATNMWCASATLGNYDCAYVDYVTEGDGKLTFRRSQSYDGSLWAAPVIIADANHSPEDNTSICMVDGFPAIAYNDTLDRLTFVRATDELGTAWGTPKVLDASVGSLYLSLAVVGGHPAVAYSEKVSFSEHLRYVQATSADGSTWGMPVRVDGNYRVAWYARLQDVGGYPGIAYLDINNTDLKYAYYTP